MSDRTQTGSATGDTRWETYSDGARLLGMKVESFRRLAIRNRWHKTKGNDGLARVAIPLEAIAQRHPHDSPKAPQGDTTPGATVAEPQALRVLSDALQREREGREAAERTAQQAMEDVARAQGEVAGLKEALRVAEDGTRREADARREAENCLAEALKMARQGAVTVAQVASLQAALDAALDAVQPQPSAYARAMALGRQAAERYRGVLAALAKR